MRRVGCAVAVLRIGADALNVNALVGLNEHFKRAVGQFEHLKHARQGARLVQIFKLGIVPAAFLLGHQRNLSVAVHGSAHGTNRKRTADEKRKHRVRKHHQVADGKQRSLHRRGLRDVNVFSHKSGSRNRKKFSGQLIWRQFQPFSSRSNAPRNKRADPAGLRLVSIPLYEQTESPNRSKPTVCSWLAKITEDQAKKDAKATDYGRLSQRQDSPQTVLLSSKKLVIEKRILRLRRRPLTYRPKPERQYGALR